MSDLKQQDKYSHSGVHLDDHQLKVHVNKLTQVIQKFFAKAAQIVLEARAYPETIAPSLYPTKEESTKLNKWFNLYMNSIPDITKDDLKLWKTSDLASLPPMIIETYIDLRQLPPNQILVLFDQTKHPWTVVKGGGKKLEVVLERWLIEFEPNSSNDAAAMVDELPLSYKQAIILFRSIYGFSRLMPAFKVRKNLHNKLPLGNKVFDGNQPISSKGRIGLSKPIVNTNSSEPHMSQKHFQPVQTSLGSLKISVAYRNDSDFCIHENEELLLTHFKRHDQQEYSNKKISSSVSPNSSTTTTTTAYTNEASVSPRKSQTPIRIQPFKVGSMSSSPPPVSTTQNQPILQSSSLERRVSITSSKSTSNVSLAAFLRNPRSGTPSTSTIPIVNSNPIYGSSVPRSVSSSTGHEDSYLTNADSTNNTPRFSSSFGSRASRRFSSTSVRQQTPQSDLLGRSNSVDAALSETEGDNDSDDISDFIRMLDSKSDLRLGNGSSGGISSSSIAVNDTLNKYQLLRSQHQQLTDSANASLILQGSRHSSRKSSLNSPPGSYDHSHHQHSSIMSSIHSRMKDSRSKGDEYHAPRRSANVSPSVGSGVPVSVGTPSLINSRLTHHTTTIVSSNTGGATKSAPTTAVVVSGLATSPSVYDYRSSGYDDVFEDDDGPHSGHSSGSHSHEKSKTKLGKKDEDDEDDLLFTMSDMNPKPF